MHVSIHDFLSKNDFEVKEIENVWESCSRREVNNSLMFWRSKMFKSTQTRALISTDPLDHPFLDNLCS